MGLENRDYLRDGDSYTERIAGWGLEQIPSTTKRLILVTVLAFVLQLIFTRPITQPELDQTALCCANSRVSVRPR